MVGVPWIAFVAFDGRGRMEGTAAKILIFF